MKRSAALLVWLAAGLGLGFTACVFFPGFLSWDSGYQWWQVRHGVIDPSHPPIMVWIWSLTDRIVAGPGGYFLYQLGLYWGSLALFVSALPLGAAWRAALVVVLGFWPPLWGLSLHLWKDVGTMSLFCLAAACFARDVVRPHRGWRVAAVGAIVLACMYRYNAVAAAFPLLAYGISRDQSLRSAGTRAGKVGTVLLAAVACVIIQAAVLSPNRFLDSGPGPRWPIHALWDIAAVSIQEDRLLIPAEWREPDLTLDVVRRDFNPEFSGRLFKSRLIRLNPAWNMSEEDYRVLRTTWLRLPLEFPRAYWSHRFSLMKTLMGWQHDPENPSLVLAMRVRPFRDNPRVVHGREEVRVPIQRTIRKMSRGTVFQGGWYVVLAMSMLVVAAWHRHALMATLAGSGLLYALPLLVLAPSSDFRYLSWTIQSALLSVLVLWLRPPGAPPRAPGS